MSIKFINKGGQNTSDATATADDIIAPKTAYVNGEKIEGAIIPSYAYASFSDYETVNNTNNFEDIDLSNNMAVSYNGNTITLYKLNTNLEIEKSFEIPVDWNTNDTKTILSVKLFKGIFEEGYIIYVQVLDTVSPFLTITRIVVSKDLKEIVSKITYNDTYHNYNASVLDIYKLNEATPNPVNPYQVAYMTYNYNGTWMYGYIRKLDFSNSTPSVTNSTRFGKAIFNYTRSNQNINIMFDKTGQYLSLLLNIDTNYPMNCSNIYYFETMELIIGNENMASADVKATSLFNLDGNVYAIYQNQLLLLQESSYIEINDINNTLTRTNKSLTFGDNILIYEPTSQSLSRYVLNESKTEFILKDSLSNINSFSYYKNGLWCNSYNEIYCWESGTGELRQLEAKGKTLYITDNADVTASDILKGKVAYGSNGKIIGTLSDENLLAENIKSGVIILGVTGTYTGETSSIEEEATE